MNLLCFGLPDPGPVDIVTLNSPFATRRIFMPGLSIFDSISEKRRLLGSDLTIMGHHYQTQSVIRHTDLRGDSLELARKAARVDSRHIVFCGVYFMGESAALVANEGQKVYLPAPGAECSMAMMADAPALEAAMAMLTKDGRKIVPLTYVNSTMAVKSVVGRYGGSVCTSANARVMLEWALAQGDAVLFLPDMNLGLNTADQMGIPHSDRLVLDGVIEGKLFNPAEAGAARLLLWPGYCSIHTAFRSEDVLAARLKYPGAKIVVHPECSPGVVKEVDACGSTSYIISYASALPEGGTLVIGTETNLVKRLAEEHKGRINVLPLAESVCEYMAETTEERLDAVLSSLLAGQNGGPESPFVVTVDEAQKKPAKAALERMLAICG